MDRTETIFLAAYTSVVDAINKAIALKAEFERCLETDEYPNSKSVDDIELTIEQVDYFITFLKGIRTDIRSSFDLFDNKNRTCQIIGAEVKP